MMMRFFISLFISCGWLCLKIDCKVSFLTEELKRVAASDPLRVTIVYSHTADVSTMQAHMLLMQEALGFIGSFSAPINHILFTGFFAFGMDVRQLAPFIDLFPEIISIKPSRKFKCLSSPNWGLGRINSNSRPSPDFVYSSDFTGRGANVYVVDSGVDTDHVELTGSTDREVRNVFDVNYAAGQAIPRNNDLMGHGTHCSGIIGGKSVGVSPSSNIYGVKVMANNGQGYDGDIIRGLQFVYDDYIARGRRPTVINMSVGGPCGSIQDCQQDTIVQAVETLVKHGIVVVVAAGNSKCDACLLTPAFAPSAITVGAIDRHDKAGIFSDFGKCVDIFAPGQEITSSCSSFLCKAPNKLVNMTGTSMAAPFVTGVVAQLFEASPGIAAADASSRLSCIAARDTLDIVMDETPSVTRNLLLQSPRKSNLAGMQCDLGSGCTGSCSSHGLCQQGACYCDTNWWGEACHTSEFGKHCSDGMVFIPFDLFDSHREPWENAEFKMYTTKNGEKQAVVASSMCGGRNDSVGACVVPGKAYGVVMTADSASAAHVGYSICGESGGAPSQHTFLASKDGTCALTCAREFLNVDLKQTTLDGWRNGYYQVIDPTTGSVYSGGSLAGLADEERHPICLDKSVKHVVAVVSHSTAPNGGVWKLCDYQGSSSDDFALFDVASGCKHVAPTGSSSSGVNGHRYPIGEFDASGKGSGWAGAVEVLANINSSYTSFDESGKVVVGSASLSSQAFNQSTYNIPVEYSNWHVHSSYWNSTSSSSTSPVSPNQYWITCGSRGHLGEKFKFKATSGGGCTRDCLSLEAVGHMKKTDTELVTVTSLAYPHELIEIHSVAANVNLCLGDDVSPGDLSCFRTIFGAGSAVSSPLWSLCGQQFSSNTVVDVCVRDWTECSATITFSPQCSNNDNPNGLLIVLYEAAGKGWGESEYLLYDLETFLDKFTTPSSGNSQDKPDENDSESDSVDNYISKGTLDNGYTGYGSFCIADGCYALTVSRSSHEQSIAWLLCGHIGQAGETFIFQVKNDRCVPVTSPSQCQSTETEELLDQIYFGFSVFMATIYIIAFIAIGRYCCKPSSLYRPPTAQGPYQELLDEPAGTTSYLTSVQNLFFSTVNSRHGYAPLPHSEHA